MASGPSYSVVIPAYNAEGWISATLESWSRQTTRDFEVILVDDGSDDGSVAVAESFGDQLDLRIIRAPHCGFPARPCNVGIKAARAPLIVHCDADDLAMPQRLEKIGRAWEIAGRQNCLIFSDFCHIGTQGEILRASVLDEYSALQAAQRHQLADDTALLSPDAAFSALLAGSFIRPCAAATPKVVLEEVGGFDESLRNAQDYDLYVRIARKYPLLWVQRALGQYRISRGNISARPALQLAPSRLAVLQKLLQLPLASAQAKNVRRAVSANYEAMAYEYGARGQLVRSLDAYLKAFVRQPAFRLLRGIAVSIVKRLIGASRSRSKGIGP